MTTSRLARRIHVVATFTLAASLASAALAATPRASSRPAAAPTAPRYRLEDSPGWYPIVDPESTAVTLGRRANAPLVSRPFAGGARSLDELGRLACRALHHSDRDSLLALCVCDDEFRDIMWREFPQSRPITGLTWEDGWTSLDQRLRSGVSGAVGDHGGQDWTFLALESDSTALYRNFRLHLRVRLMAIDDEGRTIRMTWLRAIAERKGRFKIYSTDD